MSDDFFAQLIELFNQPGPVNWKLAEQVARRLSGEPEPLDPWLAEEYVQLARVAQLTIAEKTGLETAPASDASPVDRATWAQRNLRSFRYLVEPLAEKMTAAPATGPFDAILKPLGPALLGLQMGVMLGFLSHRVLGQFDIGLPSAEESELYLVVPNVEAFARDHALDARQVRLWVALHEVAHQAEFSRSWVRPHFLHLIEDYLGGFDFDPATITEKLESLRAPEEMERLLSDPAGIAGLITTPEQRPKLEEVQAFMAATEGYGEWLMDRAAPHLLPELPKMREAMVRRRAEPSEGEQLLNRLLGLELKAEQYRLGTSFCTEVARRWGDEAVERLWEQAENLPTLGELRDPVGWAARVFLG